MTGDEIEMWLKGYAVEYNLYLEIPLKDIKIPTMGADSEAQNREADQDREIVELYGEAYKRGDQMPPLVTWAGVEGDLTPHHLIDGFTRYRALVSIKETRCAAFVVTCSEETMRRMTLTCNARHGTRPPTNWLYEQALILNDGGLSIAAAATLANVSAIRLSERRTRREARRRAERLGVLSEFTELGTFAQQKVAGIADDAVFAEFLRLIRAAGGSDKAEIPKTVKTLKELGSEAERLEHLDELRARIAKEPPAPKPEALTTKLKKRLKAVLEADIEATWKSAGTTERREIRDLTNTVCEALRKRFK